MPAPLLGLLTDGTCHANPKLQDLFRGILPDSTDIDDAILIKTFASILYERSGNKCPQLFDIELAGTWETRRETCDIILGKFDSEPLRFLRFGLPLLIKDFSDFKASFKSCFVDDIAALGIVLMSLTDSDYQAVYDKLIELGWWNSLSVDHFNVMVNSLKYFSLNDSEVRLISSSVISSPDNATKATKNLRDFLAPVGTEAQLETLCLLYAHQESDSKDVVDLMISRGMGMTTHVKGEGLFYGENKKNLEKKNKRLQNVDNLKALVNKYTQPLDLLCAFNEKKQTPPKPEKTSDASPGVAKPYDPYRKTDNRLECGLMYNMCTSFCSEKESEILIVFPSPFFIRKYILDEMLIGVKTCFVVESESEKALLTLQLEGINGTKFMPKDRPELTVATLDDILPRLGKGKKIQYTDIIVFSTKADKSDSNPLTNLATRIARTDSVPRIICIGADSSFTRRKTFIGQLAATKNKNFNSVIFVPTKINDGMSPKHKSICEIGSDPTEHTDFIFPRYIGSLDKGGENLRARQINFSGKSFRVVSNLSLGGFIKSKRDSIRGYVNNPVVNEKPQKAFEVKYTRDISFFYTKSRNKTDGKYRTYVTIRKKGRIVEDSRIRHDFNKTEEIEPWIRENYIDFARKERKPPKTIILRNVICDAYKGQPLHLESLLKLYQRKELDITLEELELLARLADSSEFIIKTIDQISAEEFSKTILSLFGDNRTNRSLVLIALAKVLSFAVEKEHCQSNVLQDQLRYSDRQDYMFSVLQSTLKTKTLTIKQDKKVLEFLKKKTTSNCEYVFLGVLIKFLTGVETNVVRALTWDDFKEVKRFGFWQLYIYKQIEPRSDAKVTALEKLSDLRCIPCSDILKEILYNQRNKLIREKRYNPESFIVTDNDEEIGKRPISARKLRAAIKETIDHLKLEDTEIIVSEGETINLSRYMNDFFRENFRFMLKDFGKCNNGEISYILGNSADSTAYQNYIDLRNDASQLSLYVKMRRIDTMIEASSSYAPPGKKRKLALVKPCTDNSWTIPEREGTSSPLLVNIYAHQEDSPYMINVSSRFGVDVKTSMEDRDA